MGRLGLERRAHGHRSLEDIFKFGLGEEQYMKTRAVGMGTVWTGASNATLADCVATRVLPRTLDTSMQDNHPISEQLPQHVGSRDVWSPSGSVAAWSWLHDGLVPVQRRVHFRGVCSGVILSPDPTSYAHKSSWGVDKGM